MHKCDSNLKHNFLTIKSSIQSQIAHFYRKIKSENVKQNIVLHKNGQKCPIVGKVNKSDS